MSLLKRAEAFLLAKAVQRGEAVSTWPADILADRIIAYDERLAMVLEGGDICEAEAHLIATAEFGASLAELRSQLSAIDPYHEALSLPFTENLIARSA
jgi:hypothetical protein